MATEAAVKQRLAVKVFSPYQVFFEGPAISLSAENAEGKFDVLYDHGKFFSLLKAGKVTVRSDFDTSEIDIRSGILKVSDNRVVLFVNI